MSNCFSHTGRDNLGSISDQKINEYCGIAGFKSHTDVSNIIYFALRSLQHRGQESAGISTFSDKIHTFKGMGLVHNVFTVSILSKLKGGSGIGHVRYSTAGKSMIDNAQPIIIHNSIGNMAIGHNGEISNAAKIKKYLKEKGISFFTESDTELIIKLIVIEAQKTGNIITGIKKAMQFLDGGYSIIFQVNDRVFGIRDPLGIKPLIIGKIDGGYGIASESVVFDTLGGKVIRDVYPGEILEITEDSIISHYTFKLKHTAHCMFEYVYFARVDSIIDGKNVYSVRRKLGQILAQEHPANADLVIPVPDSGRTHALGFAEVSHIPFAEGLMKNRYVDRTFIIPDQESRIAEIRLKLNPVREIIRNKRLVLVDDSVVRGNTIRNIVELLKNAGAKEVHVRVASPPIVAPCYLGIDMKTRDQFIAVNKTVKEIQKFINADSFEYLSIGGLVKAIKFDKKDLCLGCLTGVYPVPINGELYRMQQQLKNFKHKKV